MKLALIPPVPNLDDFEHDGFHMCLAQLLDQPVYREFYRNRSYTGDFVILDNGAHEQVKTSLARLMSYAAIIRASEVVLPDVPKRAVSNKSMFFQSLVWLSTEVGRLAYYRAGYPRLMMVPHTAFGGGQREVRTRFADFTVEMIHMIEREKVLPLDRFTIGVPLLYDNPKEGSDYYSIVNQVESIAFAYGMPVHLLGWPRNLALPRTIARDGYEIRSIDAAKPIVLARHGIQAASLNTHTYKYPGRPDNYFTSPLTEEELFNARHNVSVFRDAVTPPAK